MWDGRTGAHGGWRLGAFQGTVLPCTQQLSVTNRVKNPQIILSGQNCDFFSSKMTTLCWWKLPFITVGKGKGDKNEISRAFLPFMSFLQTYKDSFCLFSPHIPAGV